MYYVHYNTDVSYDSSGDSGVTPHTPEATPEGSNTVSCNDLEPKPDGGTHNPKSNLDKRKLTLLLLGLLVL